MIVIIDDERDFINRKRYETSLVFRNCFDAIDFFEKHEGEPVAELWLDHDLGMIDGKEHDIFTFIDYLEHLHHHSDWLPVIDKIYVHTANPVGAQRMIKALNHIGYHTTRVDCSHHLIVR